MKPARTALLLTLSMLAAWLSGCSSMPAAADRACPVAGQKQMTLVRLYFGRDIVGRAPLSDAEWKGFAASVLTPRFPDGFTVFETHGQWLDTATHHVVIEDSLVVEVALEPQADFASRIDAVADAYKQQFHQQAVGVLTEPVCARF